jgi:glycosyltransferase involved in cell wall biosynthesis
MNIIYFVYEFPPKIFGGLGTYAFEISKRFKDLGENLTVITVNWENKFLEYEKIENLEIYRPKFIDISPSLYLYVSEELCNWGEWLSYFGNIISYNHLGANFIFQMEEKGKKYDIVISHDWLGIIGGVILKKVLKIPLVFHIHSTEIGRQRGGGSNTIKKMEYEGTKIADRVFTVSYAMKEELVKFGVLPEKIDVIYNGVDEKKYDIEKVKKENIRELRNKYNIKEDEIFLFFLGRLTEVKGVKNLILAMPEVIEKYPNVKLLILGRGELENSLKDLIDKLKLNEKIILRCEFISEEERILHYAASDICVFPSLYEPFGIVSLEAMSLKKPIVVGAEGTSGMREQVITEGEEMCGVHINPHLPSSIAWGIKLLIEKDRKKLGENGRERVLKMFTWEKIAKETLKLYKKTVKEVAKL